MGWSAAHRCRGPYGRVRWAARNEAGSIGEVIGDFLSYAIGVAISPVPIIAVILMLFTERARSNSVAFLAGWILGLAIVGGIVLVIANTGDLASSDSGESTLSGVVKLLIGLVFLVLAWRNWSSRPQDGEEAHMPRWMEAIDSFTVPKSLGLAVVLAGVNPKNLGLTMAAAATIAAGGLSASGQIMALIVFILIASVTVAVPVLGYLIRGDKAEPTLNIWKDWLVRNNNTVMAVLLAVIAAKLIGDAIGVLTG